MSAVPYIGSKISLISKSDIRYEGILHEVDTQASTVALENVRICGTEDRRKNKDEFVPPSGQIYEYIVFRGSDIKDLTVEAPPKKQPNTDPAVISSTRPSNSTTVSKSQQPASRIPTASHSALPKSAAVEKPSDAVSALSGLAAAPKPTTSTVPSARATFTLTDLNSGIKGLSLQKQVSDSNKNVSGTQASIHASVPFKSNTISTTNNDHSAPVVNSRKPARDFSHGIQDERKPGLGYPQNKNTYSAGSNNFHRGPQRRGRGQGSYRGRSRGGIYVPKIDFDIQSSNAKFDKESLPEENPELISDVDPAVYYNRSISFFDNISCEAKEEQLRNRENYQLNMETFGQARSYRGGYGRGGYRGRGRGYSRQPRNQQDHHQEMTI